jgi:peptidoglycan/LPS O-acetylase OafA/YrhL
MGRLYGLDALRGVAALMVTIGHVQKITDSDWYVGHYGLAVDFFFMLSGYVMARTSEARLAGGGISSAGFVFKRIRRLWPVAAIGAAIGFALILATEPFSGNTVMMFGAALLFLPYPNPGWIFPLNGPRWSLFTELFANLVHALLLARLTNRMLSILLAAFTLTYIWIALSFGEWQLAGKTQEFLPALLRTLVSYSFGILLFRHYRDRRLSSANLPLLCAVMAFAIYYSGQFPPDRAGMFFTLLLCPWLIVAGSGVKVGRRQARFASAAGAMSFPLYAVHYPLIEIASLWLSPIAVLTTTLTLCLLVFLLLGSNVPALERIRSWKMPILSARGN